MKPEQIVDRSEGDREVASLAPEAIGRADYRILEFGMAVALGLLTLLAAFPPSGSYFVPALSIPLCALGCVHFLRRASDKRPRIILDGTGILDRTSIFGGDLQIPWPQVQGVSLSRWYGGVQVEIADIDRLVATAGLGRRVGLVLGRVVGKRSVTLDTTLLGVSRPELRMRVEGALDRYERVSLGLPGGSGLLEQ